MPGTLILSGPSSPRSQKWSHSTMDSAPQVAITGWEAAAAAVGQVAQGVGPAAAGEGDVGAEGGLQQIALAIDLNDLFALLHHGAQAGFGEHAAQPRAAAADALDEGAHGVEFRLQRPGLDFGVGQGVGAHVGGDHGVHPAGLHQQADAVARVAGVDGVDGQMPGAALQHAVDQAVGHVLVGLSADGDDLPILEPGDDLLGRSHFTQFHIILLCRTGLSGSGRAPGR